MMRKNSRNEPQTAEQDAQDLHRVLTEVDVENRQTLYGVVEASLMGSLETMSKLIAGDMQRNGFWESANTGEKIALMHSELSEALEADRKGILQDDKIPEFTGLEAELADTVIRILDFAGYHNLRLAEAIVAKCQYNLTRPHKHGKGY